MGYVEFLSRIFEVFSCRKVVCPIVLFEDYDKSNCCPLCGTLGVIENHF